MRQIHLTIQHALNLRLPIKNGLIVQSPILFGMPMHRSPQKSPRRAIVAPIILACLTISATVESASVQCGGVVGGVQLGRYVVGGGFGDLEDLFDGILRV